MTTYASGDRALDQYVSEINQYPLLTRERESELAYAMRSDGAKHAEDMLVVSNLRFVVKVAHEYRGYGLRLLDLIQEGNIGLMTAIRKFDPTKGYRLVSYAVWWIRAYVQSYIMRSWSLVKVGTTQAQRKLFFKLRSERERADRAAGPGARALASDIAEALNVTEEEVTAMEMRLGERDFSLDATVIEGGRTSHLDLLPTNNASQESVLAKKQVTSLMYDGMQQALARFNEKETHVLKDRVLRDDPPTLHALGAKLDVSRERVRQIEANVISKIKAAVEQHEKSRIAA